MSSKFKNTNEFVNTKMLLENYRTIQIAVNCREIDEIISTDDGTSDIREVFKKGRINNRQMQLLISKDNCRLLGYLEKCIEALRSSDSRFEKLYAVLFYTYFSFEEYSLDEILEKLSLKQSTYYYLLDKAIQTLSNALWGVAAVKTEEFGNLCISLVKYIPTLDDKESMIDSCKYLIENLPSVSSKQDKDKILDMIKTLQTKISYYED